MLHESIEQNTKGRDLIIGDVHGAFDAVLDALVAAEFNPAVDRALFLGDLTDRGRYSPAAAATLRQSWAKSLRGNHEQMFLDVFGGATVDEKARAHHVKHNGFGWTDHLSTADISMYVELFSALPLAMSLATARGSIGLVHAEVPLNWTWPEFVARLQSNDPVASHSALWGRERIAMEHLECVPGIDRIFCGHTIQRSATRVGNCFYLDTGAFMRHFGGAGHLTVADVCAKTQLLSTPHPQPSANHRLVLPTSANPFSTYVTN